MEKSKKKLELSVVIPAYNEENNIKNIISIVIKSLKKWKIEIIVVDDGSTDNMADKVRKLSEKYDFIHLYQHEKNKGYADALKTGFEHCKGELITFIDADLQNDPRDIPKLMEYGKQGYGAVVGWRKNRKDKMYRLLISRMYNGFIQLFFNINFPDINGKPKLFRSDVLKDIEIETKQWAVDLELVHKIKKMGYKVIQVPVEHSIRSVGKPKATIKRGFLTLINLINYRLKAI
jgi:glycosyltransferase involved in cell wall biosynthesis